MWKGYRQKTIFLYRRWAIPKSPDGTFSNSKMQHTMLLALSYLAVFLFKKIKQMPQFASK